MSDKKPVLFLMGPTASGKTDLAMAIRAELGAELISVDSALVYRDMDIGTAKPSAQELALHPHRLIDIRDPAEPYSVADFIVDAKAAIDNIHQVGKVPLLVGGTMLYFKGLLEGLADMPAADSSVRAEIESFAEQHGWPAVHQQLAQVDPEIAATIHPNHSQRISRALEVYRSSGKTMSQLRANQSSHALTEVYDVKQLAIAPSDRALLHQRIQKRFEKMLAEGFLEEVARLQSRSDLNLNLPSMRAVGYRQVWEYLAGGTTEQAMIEAGVAATRQLAKRQLTWLRKWPNLSWVDSSDLMTELPKISEQALNFMV